MELNDFLWDMWQEEGKKSNPAEIYWSDSDIRDFCALTSIEETEIEEFFIWLWDNGHYISKYAEQGGETGVLIIFKPTMELVEQFIEEREN